MEVVVFEKPCLILEAAELVYAMVNRIPAARLTEDAPYCIPVAEVEKILAEATGDLDPMDRQLLFYFDGIPLAENEGSNDRLACVAFYLINSVTPICCYEVEEARQMLHSAWFAKTDAVHILGIYTDGIAIGDAEQYTNWGTEFCKLPISPCHQVKLVEAFSAFDRHIDRLCDILLPVAEKLKRLLAPWVEKDMPRITQWRESLVGDLAQQALLKRCKVVPETVDQLQIALRYFSPLRGPGDYDVDQHIIRLHVGVALSPAGTHESAGSQMTAGEYTVLRLLSNPDRMAMLRAMTKKPKSTQELAQELGLNAGSAFRDLNNLYNAGILNLTVISKRNYFTTNIAQIEKLTTHLLQYLKEGAES